MEKKINVLIAEDLEDDLILLLRYLKRNGYLTTHKKVENEKELREALSQGGWDIVLSDYSMPQFNGLNALQIFKEYNLDIPFILLSGTIGEEIAVEAMKMGAHDYIMKDKLSRLVPAIERELNEAKNRREKEEALNKLRESEEEYRTVVENAFTIIFTLGVDGIIKTINRTVKRIGGWNPEELIGKHISTIIHPNDIKMTLEKMDNTLSGVQNEEYEIRLLKKNGKYLIGAIKTTLLKKDNKINGVLGFVRDVTARKEMEERITILSKASNQSPVSIIITDLNREITYVNEMFLKSSGFLIEEIETADPKQIIAPEVSDEYYKKMWNDARIYEIWKGEYYSKTKSGKLYWEEVSITPIKNDEGEIIRYLIIKSNITKRKEYYAELLMAKKEAEAANNLKSEFLAQMSHEIRTPLNTMLSFNQFFKEQLGDDLNDDMLTCLTGSENASRRIIRTIDLILNMTELQVGSYTPERKTIDIYSDILERLLLEKLPECKKKGLQLSLSKDTDDTTIVVDEYSATQIFDNLISNAIKYTNSGSVSINCYTDEGMYLCVDVKDTGIGIEKKNLKSIFNAFSQEEQGYTRSYEGNGLGLALVREYCKLNRASISVVSEKGVGSTFTVKFRF